MKTIDEIEKINWEVNPELPEDRYVSFMNSVKDVLHAIIESEESLPEYYNQENTKKLQAILRCTMRDNKKEY